MHDGRVTIAGKAFGDFSADTGTGAGDQNRFLLLRH
jgi:hypothetical protein